MERSASAQHTYRLVGNEKAEVVKFGMKSLAYWIIPGMLEAGSGQDMTRSQASGADHNVPWEFGERGPTPGEAVGGFSAQGPGTQNMD